MKELSSVERIVAIVTHVSGVSHQEVYKDPGQQGHRADNMSLGNPMTVFKTKPYNHGYYCHGCVGVQYIHLHDDIALSCVLCWEVAIGSIVC